MSSSRSSSSKSSDLLLAPRTAARMALLLVHKLHKRRRNAAAVASVSFLALVLIFSVFLATTRPNDDELLHYTGIFFPASASSASMRSTRSFGPLRQGEEEGQGSCGDLQSLPDHGARCRFLSSHTPPCAPQGYVDYLRLFYCVFGHAPWLGGSALALWLLVLFYLLGDTASEYFCASLEGLSAALRLPPAVAGVTLLSLGNGAPDVLSSVVAFASASGGGDDDGSGVEDVGLSGVLGGALFVSTVVAGVVSIVASVSGRSSGGGAPAAIEIERSGFVRDVCFLLVALCYLLAVLLNGSVTVWAAASFLSLYAAYVLLVCWTSSHCCAAAVNSDDDKLVVEEEEEVCVIVKPGAAASDNDNDDLLVTVPLLLPNNDDDDAPPFLLPVSSDNKPTTQKRKTFSRRVLDALQAPLYLPRRLTIPDIAAHRWSKPYAVASAFFAPLLLAAATSPLSNPAAVLAAGLLAGAVLAFAASRSMSSSAPPETRWARLPWLAGGFLMSVLWSYMLARELVSLLVATGLIAGVKPALLGATVLAWGNSLGDLVADVAMAAQTHRPGHDGGAQTALAGCYAGPAFNTVVGLGLSLTFAAGARYPEPYKVPDVDASAYEAMGFLAAGLVWALVVLPMRGMRLDRVLGVGLLVVYVCFLCLRLGSLTGALG